MAAALEKYRMWHRRSASSQRRSTRRLPSLRNPTTAAGKTVPFLWIYIFSLITLIRWMTDDSGELPRLRHEGCACGDTLRVPLF